MTSSLRHYKLYNNIVSKPVLKNYSDFLSISFYTNFICINVPRRHQTASLGDCSLWLVHQTRSVQTTRASELPLATQPASLSPILDGPLRMLTEQQNRLVGNAPYLPG